MKIKRFFSHDMRTVIKMVREELGADAVILSNNRVNGGVEVIAAVDYDESLLASQNQPDESSVDSNRVEFSNVQPTDFDKIERNPGEQTTADTQRSHKESILLQNPFEPSKRKLKEAASVQRYLAALDKQSQNLSNLPAEPVIKPKAVPAAKRSKDFRYTVLNDDIDDERALSDILNPSTRIDKTLYDISDQKKQFDAQSSSGNQTRSTTNSSDNNARKTSAKNKQDYSVWSQEPTLVDMRNEIKTLRGLLEQQLTGLAWGDMARKSPVKAKLVREMLELDLSPHLVKKIVELLSDDLDYASAWPNALALFANHIPIYDEDITAKGGVVALVGVTGVGKTTTIAKMAARFALRQGRQKVALVTTDNYRIAAHEQLRTYGRILNIPVRVAANKAELTEVLKSFSDREFVLIDTAGMGQRDHRLSEQLDTIKDVAPGAKTFVTLSTATHRTGLEEIAATFQNVNLSGCVLTKLDETTSLGGALSVALMSQLPIAYISDGQKVPEDFHLARAHSLVSRMISIAEQRGEPLQPEAIELAFNGMMTNVGI